MTKISVGRKGEDLAADFLKRSGYKIIETNYRCRFGEIDIIAVDKNTLVFIEVKTRSSREFGLPQEAVGYRKLQHIQNVAAFYRSMKKGLPEGERVDVVAIEMELAGEVKNLELIQNVTG